MKISEIFVSKKTRDMIRAIESKNDADRRIKLLGIKKSRLFITVIIVSFILSVPLFAADHTESSKRIFMLQRNEYGKGDRTVSLNAKSRDGKCEKINVTVKERNYSKEELNELSENLDEHIWTDILGENETMENVCRDLDLKTHFDGYPFTVTWKTDTALIISGSGKINEKRLRASDPENTGIPVRLCASLKYKDYSEDKYAYIVVRMPDEGNKTEEKLKEAITESDEKSMENEFQMLPEMVDGKEISFYKASVNRGWIVLFVGVCAAFFVMAAKDRKIKEESDGRRRQIEADYPRIINQYALYFTAGMNTRAIWSAICSRYEEEYESDHVKRYAYIEMMMTQRMMEEGVGEIEAYDAFSNRCRHAGFRSFISFVKQSAVKGNDGLEEMLYEEIEKAETGRNNRIRMQASEAETKLLMPMFMMLAVVLTIVMIPAFIGLG